MAVAKERDPGIPQPEKWVDLGSVRVDRGISTEGVASPQQCQGLKGSLLRESVGPWILRLAETGERMDFVRKLRRPAPALEKGIGLLRICLSVGAISARMCSPLLPPPELGGLESVWPVCILL